MYNRADYEQFITHNALLTPCQKKAFLHTKRKLFYVDQKSDKQISTYLIHAEQSHDYNIATRIYLLFNHFLKHDFVDKLLHGIKEKKYSDTKIYEYIMKHTEEHQKKQIQNYKTECSLYTYVFENLSLIIHQTFFPKADFMYLDISCGNGQKTKLFGDKLGLPKKNIYGTDIAEWGPYKENKTALPINFKLLTNNTLDFPDNHFHVLTIIFALHHIDPDSIHQLLDEFVRVMTPDGILIVIEHNVLNDYDHLIIDMEHSMNSYLYEKKPDTAYAIYHNYLEWDYIVAQHGLKWVMGLPLTGSIGFEIRYDNPYYAIYQKK